MAPKKEKLKLTDERQYFKPFTYPWAYEAWLAHEQSHWLHTEVPMLEDVKDWKNKLTDHERRFLTNIFRFYFLIRWNCLGICFKKFFIR